MSAVRFEGVDIVFGNDAKSALPLIDAGLSRTEIQEETGQVLGVANATLEVQEGEIVVLMGLSGSGKSTLLRAVNGLNPVARGRCLVQGRDGEMVDPARCGRRRLRRLRQRSVAMVFQQFGLLPWRTVRQNVALGLELSHQRKERSARVDEQLQLVGLDGWGDRKVSELSGGMQQRVGLARAFATQAPILLMDEPFSALDPIIRDRLQDDLLDLQRRLKRTIVFVSHDLDEALKLGDRIAIMEGGRIVQVGTPRRIVLEPATPYVRDFTRTVDRRGVLQARDVLTPHEGDAPSELAEAFDPEERIEPGRPALVGKDAPLREIMRLLDATGRPVLVGTPRKLEGTVDTQAVVRALA